MAAPLGNQFWKLAPKTGRKPIYENAKDLEKDCYEYLEQTSDRYTWNKQHWVGKDGQEVIINTPTPFTKSGLMVFLGMARSTWDEYKKKEEFSEIITHIEEIIFTQKFEGAATGHFNNNIIARELGLSESTKTDVTSAGEKINVISLGSGIKPE